MALSVYSIVSWHHWRDQQIQRQCGEEYEYFNLDQTDPSSGSDDSGVYIKSESMDDDPPALDNRSIPIDQTRELDQPANPEVTQDWPANQEEFWGLHPSSG